MAPSRNQGEVDTVNESVARIEAIIGRKVKRDIGPKMDLRSVHTTLSTANAAAFSLFQSMHNHCVRYMPIA